MTEDDLDDSLDTPPGSRAQSRLRDAVITGFLGLCAAGPIAATFGAVQTQSSVPVPPFTSDSFWSGRWTPKVETWLQESSTLNYHIRGLYTAMLYATGLLESPRVSLRGDWFFLRSTLTPRWETFQAVGKARRAQFRSIAERAAAAGVPLVVGVVPDRATIYCDIAFGTPQPPEEKQRILEAMLHELRATGVQVVDLRPALKVARRQGLEPYWRRDTHWTLDGAGAAATAITGAVERTFPEVLAGRLPVRVAGTQETARMSDLIGMLGLRTATPPGEDSPYAEVRALQERSRAVALQLQEADGRWRAPRPQIPDAPLALAGTSFSPLLGTALVQAARVDVNTMHVRPAGGPLEGILGALDAIERGELRPRVLVWEFVERHAVSPLWSTPGQRDR
ncbi:MAG: hypothetical protein AB7O97_05720 [Planctomycetota bacterium]